MAVFFLLDRVPGFKSRVLDEEREEMRESVH